MSVNTTNEESKQGIPKGGTANQVLIKVDDTDYNTKWDNGGIKVVTEKDKNEIKTAPIGTLVYQKDSFKGIYAKEKDGWRSQSGDVPITFIDVKKLKHPVSLNASHHNIYIHGTWSNDVEKIPTPIILPNADDCKGRIYRIVVNNGAKNYDINNSIEIVKEYGWPASIKTTDKVKGYIKFDHDFSTPKKTKYLPANRMVAIQSDGKNWVEIQNDKTESEHLTNNE